MSRRAKFAVAAEEWFAARAPVDSVSTNELWEGLCASHPALTSVTERRKTPRATCMRDVRNDPAFEVGNGRIKLRKAS